MKALGLAFLCFLCAGSALAETHCQRPAEGKNLVLVYYTGTKYDDTVPMENAVPFEVYNSDFGLSTIYVRPGEITQALFDQAALFILPGGEDAKDLRDVPSEQERTLLRTFLKNGGKFFGACLGGYWAAIEGSWPGKVPGFKTLDLLPAGVSAHSQTPEERLEPTLWRDQSLHHPYFQDGPAFSIDRPEVTTVYARHASNQSVTTFAADFAGNYRNIMVSGVHWEAPPSWYKDIKGGDVEPGHVSYQYDLFADLLCYQPKQKSALPHF